MQAAFAGSDSIMTQAILRQASASFAAVTGGQDLQQQHLMASQHHEFTFQLELRQKLQSCLCSLAQQIPLRNIGCIQVWQRDIVAQNASCDLDLCCTADHQACAATSQHQLSFSPARHAPAQRLSICCCAIVIHVESHAWPRWLALPSAALSAC